jgi:hypothetical protein
MPATTMRGLRLKGRTFKRVKGEYYGTPKEVWGFRTASVPAAATAGGVGGPQRAAIGFLAANADLFGLDPALAGLRVRKVIESLGARHVILEQRHLGARIHRGYVTVHMDRDGRVYLAKNRSVPGPLLPDRFEAKQDRIAAVRRARRSLPEHRRRATLRETELLWFPRGAELRPAWKLRLTRERPQEEWIVYVDAAKGTLLNAFDNLASAPEGRGFVFDPNPVTALGDHALLVGKGSRMRQPPPVAYRDVALPGLDGSGTLSGEKVTTDLTKKRIRRSTLEFRLRSHERGFEEVMVYYHVDRAIRYLESLGYVGRRAIFRAPIRTSATGTRQDNSWYSPHDRTLTFGTGGVDDAEDAEIIVHELGHAIQDAICPDFGQSLEAAAMGEGFGDYLAASLYDARKPARYRTTVMSWDGLLPGLHLGDEPPALRRVDRRVTTSHVDENQSEHENGVLWSATLWDIREAVGAAVADRLIVESHFQLDGFTTFARGARAIIDADRHLERGRHAQALRAIFRRRKIGPL